MKKSQACRPSGAARRYQLRSRFTSAPSARKASRCGSSRRRPITSPPGGGMLARPRRASSGPASRKEARMRSAQSRSTSNCVSVVRLERHDVVVAPLHFHAEAAQDLEHRLHVGDARDVAQHDLLASEETRGERGQCGVLVSCGRDGPRKGRPAFDDELLHLAARSGADEDTLPSVAQPTRDEAWDLVCEWTAVRVPPQAHAGRGGGDARLRAEVRRGRGAVRRHRAAARPRLRALSGPRHRPSARGAEAVRGAAATRRS